MISVLLFFLAVILCYMGVAITILVQALNRQAQSSNNLERFLVEWLGDFQKERQAGSLQIASETRALRKTSLLFLKMVHFAPSSGSTYSARDLQTLLDGVQDQDERLTG